MIKFRGNNIVSMTQVQSEKYLNLALQPGSMTKEEKLIGFYSSGEAEDTTPFFFLSGPGNNDNPIFNF
jgi:hypothetical protein